MKKISGFDFELTNIKVWCCDIDGGFYHGGISVIINLQNSNKVLVNQGSNRNSWPISSFQEGVDMANEFLNSPDNGLIFNEDE